MTESLSSTKSLRADLDTLIVGQILELESRAADLDRKAEGLRKRAEAWKRSRWGRLSALAARRRPATAREKIGFVLRAIRLLLTGRRGQSALASLPTAVPASPSMAAAPKGAHREALERDVARRGANLAPAVELGRRLVVAAIMDPFTRRDRKSVV